MPSALKSPATQDSRAKAPATRSPRARPTAVKVGAIRHGATRRSRPPAEPGLDRWLDLLVSVSVVTAMIVGSVALIVTLLFT